MSAFEKEYRRRGIRVTPQRLAVYRAVSAAGRHPTAEVVHRRLRALMPSLSLATVYRTLEFLEAEGLVRRVSTTDSVAHYDANLARHHHLVCRVCRSIEDLDPASAARISVAENPAPGFRVESVEVHVVGVCRACRRRPVARPGAAAR